MSKKEQRGLFRLVIGLGVAVLAYFLFFSPAAEQDGDETSKEQGQEKPAPRGLKAAWQDIQDWWQRNFGKKRDKRSNR